MGEAFTAVGKDLYALYWNPAGITGFDVPMASVSHAEWFQGVRFSSMQFSLPIGTESALAFGLNGLYVTGIEKRAGPTDLPDGTFDVYHLIGTAAYATKLGEAGRVAGVGFKGLWGGAGMKFLYERWETDQALAGAVDVGIWIPLEDSRWSLGAVLQHVGWSVAIVDRAPAMPGTMKVGAAYHAEEGWGVAADLGYQWADRRVIARAGAEYTVEDVLTVRAGYTAGLGEMGALAGVRAGVGLRVGGTLLDYAFAPYGDLGGTHRISVTNPLGRSVEEDRVLAAKLTNQLIRRELAIGAEYRQFAEGRPGDLVGSRMAWESAKISWDKVLALEPEQPQARVEREAAVLSLRVIDDRLADRQIRKTASRFALLGSWTEVLSFLEKLHEPLEEDQALGKRAREEMEEAARRALIKDIANQIARIKDLMQQEQYAEAHVACEAVLKLAPAHVEAGLLRQRCLEKLREPEQRAKLRAELEQRFAQVKRRAAGGWDAKAYRIVTAELADIAKQATATFVSLQTVVTAYQEEAGRSYRRAVEEALAAARAQPKSFEGDHDGLALAKAIRAWAVVRGLDDRQVEAEAWFARWVPKPEEAAKSLDRQALQSYVTDELEAAVAKWEAVLLLDPEHRVIKDALFNIEKARRKLERR